MLRQQQWYLRLEFLTISKNKKTHFPPRKHANYINLNNYTTGRVLSLEELMIPGMKNIDYDKTADNVARFLTDKRYYPRLYKIYQQASPEFIQSPSLSGMPGGSIGNSNEEKLVKYLYAKSIVDGVADTYDKGSVELKVVLDNVLGKISAVEAMMRLHFEKTRYYQIRKMALNEFADGLEMKINCPDLHIYV